MYTIYSTRTYLLLRTRNMKCCGRASCGWLYYLVGSRMQTSVSHIYERSWTPTSSYLHLIMTSSTFCEHLSIDWPSLDGATQHQRPLLFTLHFQPLRATMLSPSSEHHQQAALIVTGPIHLNELSQICFICPTGCVRLHLIRKRARHVPRLTLTRPTAL